MKKIVLVVALLCLFCHSGAQIVVSSPNGKLSVKISAKDGHISYRVSSGKEQVTEPSALGFNSSLGNFTDGLTIISSYDLGRLEEYYTLAYGKKTDVAFEANATDINIQNGQGRALTIRFRVSNDAVAFQYYLPGKPSETVTIREENTTYSFPAGTLSWLQPMQGAKTGWEQSNPAYEEHYRQAVPLAEIPDSVVAGWVYPALFKTGSSWVTVTEAGMDGSYCATRLMAHPAGNSFSIGFPDPREVFTGKGYLPTGRLPFTTPWRVMAVGSLKTIMESTAGTDFAADRNRKSGTSFIKPGKASWSWINSKDNYIVYDEQKKYIDFAAAMHWQYCLIDADWDRKIGYDKIKELADYAATKQVSILLWYNSAGDWNTVKYTPKNLLLTPESRRKEFSRIHQMGIKGVKIDFFGGDGQSVMQYYTDILKDAADYQLMVNFHGATLPRGWVRTYPQLMTTEAIRGFENVTFRQQEADREAEMCAMAPFTRNLYDPMDYTPMNLYKINGRVQRRTTSAFELALPVLFLSGIQHFAESPDGMKHVPGYVQDFLGALPVKWDDVQFIDGYPGKYVVIARRAGRKWYIAGINSQNAPQTVSFNTTSFGSKMHLIFNGKGQLDFARKTGKTLKKQKLVLPPLGGFVMVAE